MKELLKDIQSGSFRQVYLLTGDEPYLIRQYRDKLIDALIPGRDGMNLTIYSGDKLSEAEIISQAETLPFFADRRVICVEQSGFFKNAAERLPAYLTELPDYLTLLFVDTEVDKRNRLYKAVAANGFVAVFERLKEDQLALWVGSMLKEAGIAVRPSVVSHLLSKTGDDMTHIRLETDKLIHYCSARRDASEGRSEVLEASEADVDAIVTDQIENKIFVMIDALTNRRRQEAMNLYADLLALKEPPMRILYLIAQQYHRLLMIHELDAAGNAPAQIAAKAGIPPFAVRKNLRLARHYTPEKLTLCLRQCLSAEERVKTGEMNDRTAVELVLLGI